nr:MULTISPECIES: OmpA family protein [unclassified Oceanispirochaeta]
MEEEYQYLDGSSLREKGFLLTFYKGIELLDRPGLRKDVETVLADQLKDSFEEKGESLTDQISVEERDEGLALNLKNLHFKADEAVILPEDRPLLDTIAEVLKKVPDRTFLVKGHTADIGTMESQIILSQERARTIVEELSSRGIEADRFLFTGMGGLMPLGDNATDEGRRQNRRVEIFILED